MSNREDADSSPSIRQAVEEEKIIRLKNELTDEERQRLITPILTNRSVGELLLNAFVDESEEAEESESDE